MADTKNVSNNCAKGKHTRCLGTVIAYPPVEGERISACQCSASDCPHVRRAAVAALS